MIIPAAGVIASTAVAITAVFVTVRLARVQRAEAERSQRLEYALAIDLALAEYRSRLQSGEIDYQRASSIKTALHDVTVKMNAAAVSVRDVSEVDAWLKHELTASLAAILAEAIDGHQTRELQALRERVGPRLFAWARTGRLGDPAQRPTDDAV